MLAAVAWHGYALQHASAEMQNDKEAVLAAVKQNGRALEYASAKTQKGEELACGWPGYV